MLSRISRTLRAPRSSLALIPALTAIAIATTPALTASATTPPSADLASTLTSQGIAIPGGAMGYKITVTNNGPNTASDMIITDSTPSSPWKLHPTTFLCVGSVPLPGSGAGWCGPLPSNVSCTAPKVGSPGTVTCTTSSLLAHASMTIIMAIDVGFYLHNMAICDMASATSSTSDSNTANNTATVCNRVN